MQEKNQDHTPKKRKRRNKEKLSVQEIEELMGTNRDTYQRHKGGAIRRKGN